MRTKITLILLLLNVALLAVILYTRHEWNTERALNDVRKKVLGDEVVGLVSIEIKNTASGDTLKLARDKTTDPWSIITPINWPANDFAVKRIIHELEFLENETSFHVKDLHKNGQSLAEYGLKPPSLTLSLTRAPAVTGSSPVTTTLGIGDTSKVGNRLYLLSPDKQNVEVVSRSLADSLKQGLEQLRSDALFTIPVYEVRSLSLQVPAPDGKNVRVRVRRDNPLWSFEAPIVTRASRAAVETSVVSLNSLRADRFLSKADAPAERTGLDNSTLRVTLEGNNRRETLIVGQPVGAAGPEATEFYAQLEGRDQVFTTSIPNKLSDSLHRAQETLRDTHILVFDPSTVTSITLTPDFSLQRLDSAAGGNASWQIVLRTGDQGSQTLPADTDRVNHFLQRLTLLVATPHLGKDGKVESGFLSDAPSSADLENWGFNLPARKITLTFAPISATGTAATTPIPITLLLAVSGGTGNFVQARIEGQSFVYAVPEDTLNDLPIAPRLYRDRTLRTLPEGARITGLSLTETDKSAPIYTRHLGPDETWATALASESAEKRTALETLLTQLRTLRAKQFVGDSFTPTTIVDGQPKPWKYKLEATLALGGGTGDQTTTSTLFLGERTGGGTLLAGSPEFNVVFEVEQPLLDALWTLTYGPRDPGEPAAPGAPATEATPAATTPQPATANP
ncbi:MAG TPA: DUF4340 domain-containing protein [Rariglobus sp.]|jgi:hypothetical protein|nr:DUF4340 domain-containing protein [Rariglobus sp.]